MRKAGRGFSGEDEVFRGKRGFSFRRLLEEDRGDFCKYFKILEKDESIIV